MNAVLQQERRLPWQPSFAANRATTAERMDETTMPFRKFSLETSSIRAQPYGFELSYWEPERFKPRRIFFVSTILLQVAHQGYFVSYQSNLNSRQNVSINTRHVEFSKEWSCTVRSYGIPNGAQLFQTDVLVKKNQKQKNKEQNETILQRFNIKFESI